MDYNNHHPPPHEYSQPSPHLTYMSDTNTVPRSYYSDYPHHQQRTSQRQEPSERTWSDPLPKQKFSTDYRTVPPSTTSRPNFQRYGSTSGAEYCYGKYGLEKSETKRTATDERPVETPRKRWRQAWDTDLLDGRRRVNETATIQMVKNENTEETRGNLDTRDYPRDLKILSDRNNARVAAVNSLMEGGATYEEAYAATRDMAENSTRKFDPSTAAEPGEIVGDEEVSVPSFKPIDLRICEQQPKSFDMADAFLKKIADGIAASDSPYKSYDSSYKSRARSPSPGIRNRERGRSVAPRARRNGSPYRSSSLGGSSRSKRQQVERRDQDKRREKVSSRDEISPVKSSYVGRRGSSPGPVRKYSVDHRDTNRREPVVYSVDHRAVKRYDPYMRDRRNSSAFDRNRDAQKRSTSRGRSDAVGRGKERVPESDIEQDRRSRSRDGRRSPYDRGRDRRDSNAARVSERSRERNRDPPSNLQNRRNKDGNYEKDRGRNADDSYRNRDGNLDRFKNEERRQPYVKGETEPDERKYSGTHDRATDKDAPGGRNARDRSPLNGDKEIRRDLHRESGTYYSALPANRVQQAPLPTAVGELHSYRHSMVPLDLPNSLERRPPLAPEQAQFSEQQHFYSPSFFSQNPQHQQQRQQQQIYQQIPVHPEYPMQTPLLYQTVAHPPGNNLEQQNLGNYQVLGPQNHLVSLQTPGIYVATPPNVMVNHPPPSQMINQPGVVYMDVGGRSHMSDPNSSSMYQMIGSGQYVPAGTHAYPGPLREPLGMLVRPAMQPMPNPKLQFVTEPRSSRPTEFGWPMIEYVDGLMNRLRREIITTPSGKSSEQQAHPERVLTVDTKVNKTSSMVRNQSPPTAFRPNSTSLDAKPLGVAYDPQHMLSSSSPSTSIPRLENLKIVDGTPTTGTEESSPGALKAEASMRGFNESERAKIERNGVPVESNGKDASSTEARRSQSLTPLKGAVNEERIVYNETDLSVEELRAEHGNYRC